MKSPRAILFDHDGVLVASEPLHWEAWRRLLQEIHLPYEEGEIRASVGKTAPRILTEILDRHRPGWDPTEFDVNALALKKNDFYLKIAQTELRTYPGVPQGLKKLRERGMALAVVSNAKRRELESALKLLGIFPYFNLVVSRDDISPPKPDPTPYLFAAASLGFEPADCIAVEDSPPGLEAALMAKIPTAAVLTNFPRQAVEQPVPGRPDLKPVWVGASLETFFDWIDSLL
jgi:HAD superfamily hydrolase (TIGR01509 family)